MGCEEKRWFKSIGVFEGDEAQTEMQRELNILSAILPHIQLTPHMSKDKDRASVLGVKDGIAVLTLESHIIAPPKISLSTLYRTIPVEHEWSPDENQQQVSYILAQYNIAHLTGWMDATQTERKRPIIAIPFAQSVQDIPSFMLLMDWVDTGAFDEPYTNYGTWKLRRGTEKDVSAIYTSQLNLGVKTGMDW